MKKFNMLKLLFILSIIGSTLFLQTGCGDDEEPINFDRDYDGVIDIIDNCVDTPNPNQEDIDDDGIGDACDINYWTRAEVDFSKDGWNIGDFNGDNIDDVFRIFDCGVEVFLSDGVKFISSDCWTYATADFSNGGWHVGDFNGDGKDDIFRYEIGSCGAEVFLSDGSSFSNYGCWTTAGVDFSNGGWYVGDFNGDGKDDIFRYEIGSCGAEVFLSDGSSFNSNGCWTTAGVDFSNGGWHVGDFDGNGKDDLFRYEIGSCGAEVFLSDGNSFNSNGCWTTAGVTFNQGGWYIGDFDGEGKEDIFRYLDGVAGAQVFLSNGNQFE